MREKHSISHKGFGRERKGGIVYHIVEQDDPNSYGRTPRRTRIPEPSLSISSSLTPNRRRPFSSRRREFRSGELPALSNWILFSVNGSFGYELHNLWV